MYLRIHREELSSTSDLARELVRAASVLVIVSADVQTQGRGRNDKVWLGEKGSNLYMSYAIPKPNWSETTFDYQVASCVAVAKALQKLAPGIVFHIKYPNDIYATDQNAVRKKIAGILVETEFTGAVLNSLVIGIGVNVNQLTFGELRATDATSLHILSNEQWSLPEVQETVIEHLTAIFNRKPEDVYEEWKTWMNLQNKEYYLNGESKKHTLTRILRDGRLEVRCETDGELRTVQGSDTIRYEL